MERIHYVHVTICSDTPYYEEYHNIFAAKAIETPEVYEADEVEDMNDVVDREIKEPASKVIKGGPWIASNTQ